MLLVAVTILFAVCAFVASGLAYDEKRWRYPFLGAGACAMILTIWGGQGLRNLLSSFIPRLPPIVAAAVVALPLGLVLWSLFVRRKNTPRHTPSINDDPVLRRHLEEKTRRARKRRQDDDALENSDVPSL